MVIETDVVSQWPQQEANSEAIMAVDCVAKLFNWLKGSRASIRDLIRQYIGDKYFRTNRVAVTMIGVVATTLAR